MAIQDFEKDELSEKDKRYIRMRGIMDIGMGILWTVMGIFFLFSKYLELGWENRFDNLSMKTFGFICLLYGIYRVYRGYKKNYLR